MAGLIPQDFLDSILERTDIVELIDGYLPLKKQGTSFAACCPFHHEKSPSFNVIPRKQFYHCFGCGASGNAIGFVMGHLHLGFIEAVELLAARLGLEVPRNERDVQRKKVKVDLYGLLNQVSLYYQETLKNIPGEPAQTYLTQRGLNAEIIQTFQLGYAPQGWHTLTHHFKDREQDLLTTGMLVPKDDGRSYDRYRHRLMFPIHDRQGRVIGFGGRALDSSQQPKYLNSPETPLFHKSHELYGLHQLLTHDKSETIQQIIVVEGYMDVIALVQHGISNAVATLGTATTTHHLQLLGKYTNHVVFCFDGDEAGRKAAWRALENSLPMLNTGLELQFMFLPEAHDPDSYVREKGEAGFLALMQQATPLHQFFLETLSAKVSLHTLSGKSQLVQLSLPYLQQIPEGVYKSLLIDHLARMTRMDSDRIQQFVLGKDTPLPMHDRTEHITRSPLRLAMALLLQYPERWVGTDIQLESQEEPGMALLRDLLSYLARVSSVSTAILIEQWRDTQWFDAVQKLSCWDHQIPEDCIEAEFKGLIALLNRQALEKRIEHYLTKSRAGSLEQKERETLQQLLKQRHQVTS